MRRTSTPASPTATLRKGRSASRFDALIKEATVDAYDESEQKAGFFTMLENHLAVPFSTEVLGMTVTVETIRHDRRRGDRGRVRPGQVASVHTDPRAASSRTTPGRRGVD